MFLALVPFYLGLFSVRHRLLLFENEAKLRALNFGWPFNGVKQ